MAATRRCSGNGDCLSGYAEKYHRAGRQRLLYSGLKEKSPIVMQVVPSSIKTNELHALLLGAIAPRPICFASTIDKDGNPNLSPFSFFNIFGSNPPTIIFSPA